MSKAGRNRPRSNFNLRGRLVLVGAALSLCSVTLIGRAAYVQIINSDFYQRQGEARYLRELPIATSRGMITDRNGEPLAVSTPVESIWVNPQELLRNPDRIPQLAQALELPSDELTAKLSQKSDKEFMYLKRRINPDKAHAVVALGIPGVFSQREFRRFYPQGEAMAHVLGFTNIDDRGQEGLELAYDEWLRGKPGSKRVIRDRKGAIVESIDLVKPAEPGKDLTLSIDRRIQFLAYKELRNALAQNNAAGGSIVVMDVATGEIMAMVNLPTYNPNSVTGVNSDARRNRAVTDLVEPGSTMKPLTISTALKAGVVTKDTLIDTNPGYMAVGRFTIKDVPRNNGVLTVTGVITRSSNIGAAKIGAKLPDQTFYDQIHSYGYGSAPHSGFPGESAGVLPPPGRWSGSSKTTMSYGYGLSVTPLQIARAYCALGNGGKLVTPTFIKGQHEETKGVLSPAIAKEVVTMMETVVTQGGAKGAAILGYHVAGKTGTARLNGPGGYIRGHYNALFAGLVPASNPRFATVIVINDPQGAKYYGGLVSAPVFHNVMEGALRLMDVPPDDIQAWLAAQAAGKSGHAPPPVPVEPDPALVPDAAAEVEAALPSVRAVAPPPAAPPVPVQETRQ
ncbi:peptidoglycan D,D-transpeptidase FtsI family protein [Xanthomonas translucens]|uniref:peptidoglycan D,D-transpeptidase FtsI family protein n=7 Tax=Xanthomonas campestris pv. translucens TaxID=343 RepID=UPI0002A7959B|nr:penicillin-binding transpeptidase domain-containing protein [Xanthomonas translucens]AKK68871.1 cell division protein [Xanthomonas translucens pv. undulosa]ELQ16254.1 cell division protein ftsi [Xanthomonas translucens DAR61454]MBC3971024.1 penicillin-binding protein 2 [Xanthomonas translucens pv. undulosa]MCT8270986.1 penicillin-binding transpeptidase domain-containing protein [Xanthomonas translucens pv. undulosa]MCT8282561.1 penicillin-binding transpeptidase domain-containing protein [Xa